jgi:hypothetical protein
MEGAESETGVTAEPDLSGSNRERSMSGKAVVQCPQLKAQCAQVCTAFKELLLMCARGSIRRQRQTAALGRQLSLHAGTQQSATSHSRHNNANEVLRQRALIVI